jgi:16S rRNA (cytidine1402-2'-O)-methyltransferase
MEKHKGTLYLIPSFLGETEPGFVFPERNKTVLTGLKHYIVEEVRTARRFLKKISPEISIDDLTLTPYNEHNINAADLSLLESLLQGHDTGLISEAGVPCIADPGSEIVRMAHENGIRVVPLTGPSSILLALMASGFNGQRFCFHGYLPIDARERAKKIRDMEQDILKNDRTQIFIETPYRNLQMLKSIVETGQENTLLCIATDLSSPSENIITLSIHKWKNKNPDLHKRPAVFLLYR